MILFLHDLFVCLFIFSNHPPIIPRVLQDRNQSARMSHLIIRSVFVLPVWKEIIFVFFFALCSLSIWLVSTKLTSSRYLLLCFIFILTQMRIPGYTNRESALSDLSRVYTHSYLTAEPSQGYLKRPLEPRPPKSPQFHRPPGKLLAINY